MATTRQQQIYEYIKCAKNPKYTIETYMETYDKTNNGFVEFKLFPRQKEIIDGYEDHRFNMVLKYRQAGITTITAAYGASVTTFSDPKNPEKILIIANKQETAKEFLAKMVTFIKQIPDWAFDTTTDKDGKQVPIYFTKESAAHVKMPNGAEIKAVGTSKDALRGYTPTIIIFDEAAFIEGGADLWAACTASVSCLAPDTLVLTSKGMVKLCDLMESSDIGFHTLNIKHEVLNRYGEFETPTKGYVSEDTEMYKIHLDNGMIIDGSWKHPILVNNQWTKLNEINDGDLVDIKYNQNMFGENDNINLSHLDFKKKTWVPYKNIDLSENLDLSYLMGLFVAEGSFSKNTVQICTGDEEIQNRLLKDGYGSKPFKSSAKNKFYMTSKFFVELFNEFGIKQASHASNKKIPYKLLQTSKKVQVSFLRGLFDGDGCVHERGVKYSSTSHELVLTLQQMLFNFGIKSNIRYSEHKTAKTSVLYNKDHVCKIYELHVVSSDTLKFMTDIGFGLTRKQALITNFINKRDLTRVAFSKDECNKMLSENNISYKEYDKKYRFLDGVKRYNRDYITKYCVSKCVENNFSGETLENLLTRTKLTETDFKSKVVKIETYVGESLDLHLPETNSFIANSIVNHNTGGKIYLISTPNGQDQIYYKSYNDTMKGKGEFNIVSIKWWEDPRYRKHLQMVKADDAVDWIAKPDGEKTEEIIDIPEDIWSKVDDFDASYIQKYISEGYKPISPWYVGMCKLFNLNKRLISQELECVMGDTLVTVKNRKTGLIEELPVEELYNRL